MRLKFLAVMGLSVGLAAPAFAQDIAAGQRVFNASCRACHTVALGGRQGVGPNLHGFLDRRAAGVEGFRYSAPMRRKAEEGLVWTPATVAPYLRNPREAVPGTSMAFAGIRDDQQIADLIAFLQQATGAAR